MQEGLTCKIAGVVREPVKILLQSKFAKEKQFLTWLFFSNK